MGCCKRDVLVALGARRVIVRRRAGVAEYQRANPLRKPMREPLTGKAAHGKAAQYERLLDIEAVQQCRKVVTDLAQRGWRIERIAAEPGRCRCEASPTRGADSDLILP